MDIAVLKAAHNITDIIGRTVQLKKRGQRYRGLCPLHPDTDPSLVVYPSKQSFRCYGCGKSGDVIDWIQASVGVDFKAAIKLLGHIPEVEPRPLFKPQPKRFRSISQEAAKYWHSRLGKRRTYFHDRGFADNTIDRELFGFDGRRYTIPLWMGVPQESILAAVKLRRDDEGEVKRLQENGLNGEALRNALKLIPRYLLKGSSRPLLYHNWRVLNEETAFVFFGEFDCALAAQLGLPACSPVHGAGSWQSEWGNTYLRYAREIIIVPDRQERKQGYTAKSLIGGHARVFRWPEGELNDFTDYILQGGSCDSFLQLCRNQNLTNFSFHAII